MRIILSCPQCGQSLQAPSELAGAAVQCPGCGRTFEAAQEAPPAISVPPPLAASLQASAPPLSLAEPDQDGPLSAKEAATREREAAEAGAEIDKEEEGRRRRRARRRERVGDGGLFAEVRNSLQEVIKLFRDIHWW
jgi:hypothetical protein